MAVGRHTSRFGWSREAPPWILSLGAAAVPLAVGLALIAASSVVDPVLVLLLLVALAVVAGLIAVPIGWLPSIAIASILFVPLESLPIPAALRSLHVGILVLVVWQLRAREVRPGTTAAITLALVLTGWLVASTALAPFASPRSATWSVFVLVTVVAFSIRAPVSPSDPTRTLLLLATPLAAFAVVESFVLGHNPLLGAVYQQATGWADESTAIHRATTFMGHPLLNGTVFAAAAVLAMHRLVTDASPSPWRILQLLLLLGGIAASQTRTGAIAAVIGFVLVVALNARSQRPTRTALVAVLCAVAATAFVYALQERNDAGLAYSAAHRQSVPAQALASVSGYEVFGVGPAMSDSWRARQRLPGTAVTLENSYAQLLVSIGPAGMLIFLGLLLVVVRTGLRHRATAGAAFALAAVIVALAGFNAIEASTRMLILLAILIATIHGATRHLPSSTPSRDPS